MVNLLGYTYRGFGGSTIQGHKVIRYDKSFCKHRWSNQKRWQENMEWFAIRRCRWCDTWQRIKISLGIGATKVKPVLTKEQFDETYEGAD